MDRQDGVQCIALIIDNDSASWSMLQPFFPHVVVIVFRVVTLKVTMKAPFQGKQLSKQYGNAYTHTSHWHLSLTLRLTLWTCTAQRLRQSPHTLQLRWHGMIINQNCFCGKLMLGKTTKTWNGADGIIGDIYGMWWMLLRKLQWRRR